MRQLFTSFLMLTFSAMLFAQGSISGTLIDSETGEALVFAPVTIKNTNIGVSTDIDGKFEIRNIEPGTYTVILSYVGYDESTQEVSVEGRNVDLGIVSLSTGSFGLEEIKVIASVVDTRQTPMAVSNISTEEIEDKIGNQDFPQLLATTPSVYTTRSGGGFGDARINIRGFDQSNTAVMINGIPVNDMENGWVYWSNWAGLSDVTRQMQVQRGLGASKLAINSIGGTINVITKTTDMKTGGKASFTIGNNNFLKYGLTASTGLLKGNWAITLAGSRTTGDGYVDGTWVDAYNYFGSISKQFGDEHYLTFTAIGAPQKHGQRTSRTSLESTEDPEYLRQYNPDWGYKNGEVFSLRENFYHKPQMALNHIWEKTDKFLLATSVYYSTGRGGGTGDRGRIGGSGYWGYRDADQQIRFDDIERWNSGEDNIEGFPTEGNISHEGTGLVAGENNGIIRRASINSHNWYGALSTFKKNFGDRLNLMVGVDLRNYKGLHYRRVDDLLGNDYWLDPHDVNAQETTINLDGSLDSLGNPTIGYGETGSLKKEGDKMGYDNDGLVDWEGLFAQLEYTSGFGLSAFVTLSGSNTGYKRVDRFNYEPGNQETKRQNFLGYTTKAGVNYNFSDNHNFFVNGGYYSRAPFFDAVFLENTNDVNEDPQNEKALAFEAGYGINYKKVAVNFNFYNTIWQDKTFFRTFENDDGDNYAANILGLNAIHRGLEVDALANPAKGLTLRGQVSIGDWRWKNNVEALIFDDNGILVETLDVYAADLKVGDAAQFTLGAGIKYEFNFGLGVELEGQYYADLYEDFDPASRTSPEDIGVQATRLPSYGLLSGGLFYKFNLHGYGAKVRFNMNNITDKLYVAELSGRGAYYGAGRTWNLGFTFDFWK